jgi:serine/threonine protein kinase
VRPFFTYRWLLNIYISLSLTCPLFLKQTAMLVGLSHPNILALFGTSKDTDGSMYQILEFCDGGDLAVSEREREMDDIEIDI